MDIGGQGSGAAPGAGGSGRPRMVVGVDGSPGARVALRYALATAARRGAQLEVVSGYLPELYWVSGAPVSVPQLDDVRADVRDRAAALVAEVRAETPGTDAVPVEVQVVADRAAAALVRHSAEADLLVVGSRGRGSVRSALLGSVALHCATHARCPVVVVHPSAAEPAGPPRVVVGVDGSASARAALAAAVAEAVELGAEVEVVAAYSRVDFWTDVSPAVVPAVEEVRADVLRTAEEEVAAVLAERSADATPAVRIEVCEGAPSDVLVDRAKGAALLVVGSRGRGALRGLMLGSVALHCAMRAPCPVLLVRPQQDRSAASPVAAGQPGG